MGGRDHPDLLLFTEENQRTLGNADYEMGMAGVGQGAFIGGVHL